MATLEQIIEEARTLSLEERRRLRGTLDRELRDAQPYRTNERERAWIEAHRDEYLGQWVALDGDTLLAAGTNPREVTETARAAGVGSPYLERIHPKDNLPFGGW